MGCFISFAISLTFQSIELTNNYKSHYFLRNENFQESPILKQYKGLNEMLCSVIGDYDLVKFTGLDVTSKKHMLNLLKLVDTANGYIFTEAPDLRNIVQR